MGTAPGAARVPLEVWERILLLLDAGEIVRVRSVRALLTQATRALYRAGTSLSLWRRLCARLEARAPLPALPADAAPEHLASTSHVTAPLLRSLERAVLFAERLAARWDTRGARPRRVVRLRAPVNRITSLKLVVGDTHAVRGPAHVETACWLVTGSVDGYVRVWDVNKALCDADLDVAADYRADDSGTEAEHASVSSDDDDDDDARRRPSMDSAVSDDPAMEIRRHARACLVAEADTGGDITSLDAHYDRGAQMLRIAVGSYYSSAGCLLYDLRLRTRPHVLDLSASLDPPQWSGTQCVSLLGDAVGMSRDSHTAVGTYLGSILILDTRAGTPSVLERSERGSIAALKLFPAHVLAVTRVGQLEVYALPPPGTTAHALPIASLALAPRALLSVAISEPDPRTAGVLPRMEHWGTPTPPRTPLSVLAVDPAGLSHFVMRPTPTPFPYALPTLDARIPMHGERLIGAALGASGHRAVLVSSLGGVLPVCAVRGYEQTRAADARLVPLRPTPDTDVPADAGGLLRPASAASLSAPVRTDEPPRPRAARVDSFSSTSTSASSAAPSPSSRTDMLTECALDEAHGLVCLASVRGAVWISDYGTCV